MPSRTRFRLTTSWSTALSDESGIGKSLSSSQATPDKGLRIRLENVPFDALVAWLARLSQSHGVRVESAEIEAAGEPGLVNAGLLLKAG